MSEYVIVSGIVMTWELSCS